MEFDVNKVLAHLDAGEDAKEIADAFANVLNAAVKAKEAKKTKEKTEQEKNAQLGKVVEDFLDYIFTYYPAIKDSFKDIKEDYCMEDLVKELSAELDKVLKVYISMADVLKNIQVDVDEEDEASPLDVIGSFLKANGLK